MGQVKSILGHTGGTPNTIPRARKTEEKTMIKNIIREVAPEACDFGTYFEVDGLTRAAAANTPGKIVNLFA